MIGDREMRALVQTAIADDQRAWERLVAEFTPMIRGIARRHRLGPFEQDEVVQRTFLALVRHIGRLRDPLSVPGWISTTARRASLAVIGESAREVPTADVAPDGSSHADHDHALLQAERREAVRSAVERMPERQRALVSALSVEPALSQQQVSERLGMPIGSIGPTRQRCLERMRRDPGVAQLLDEHVSSAQRPARSRQRAFAIN
ncbi:MAG TPA: sigma-70 family RNA polymerase sigma factor [Solirubrobacteraceae bacterium]|jgi:RNA polymerase sigma factor (sigma-70 family)|nr:sigma-70 family RNA polymerase sigma factor [Solirubrobacteraceae bacterium]